jgi:hypothetical protein
LGVPSYIKKRIADPKYEKTWLMQLLSNMDTEMLSTSSSTTLPTLDENGSVRKLAESFEDKRKRSSLMTTPCNIDFNWLFPGRQIEAQEFQSPKRRQTDEQHAIDHFATRAGEQKQDKSGREFSKGPRSEEN